jgi:FkbM family methyltransferase
MKNIIQKFFKHLGWELRRVKNIDHSSTANSLKPSMKSGLQWLADHDFHFNTVLDVGASDGRWTAECMAFYPKAQYILFEPQPVHSKVLDDFANTYKQNVVLVKKAVGASEGYTLFDASDPLGGALAHTKNEHTIKVDLTTIDSTILKEQAEAPFLLKLDTHGFEKSIFNGSNNTLEKCEALIIEAYNFRITEEAMLFWELCSFLSKKGFRPIDLVDILRRQYDNSLWQMDLFFIRSDWKGYSYNSYN